METDRFGLQLLDHGAIGRIERRPVGGADRRSGIEPQLRVVGAEPRLPAGLAPGISVDRLVAEEVQIERRRDALADDVDLLARLVSGNHRTGQRAQRTALRRGDHEIGIHDARHRRQHDREFGLEEVEETAIRPHGVFSLVSVRQQ